MIPCCVYNDAKRASDHWRGKYRGRWSRDAVAARRYAAVASRERRGARYFQEQPEFERESEDAA